jgi:hypothetical protein
LFEQCAHFVLRQRRVGGTLAEAQAVVTARLQLGEIFDELVPAALLLCDGVTQLADMDNLR